jgi:hypothetical protein
MGQRPSPSLSIVIVLVVDLLLWAGSVALNVLVAVGGDTVFDIRK